MATSAHHEIVLLVTIYDLVAAHKAGIDNDDDWPVIAKNRRLSCMKQ